MASVNELVQRKKLQLAKQLRSLQKQADTLKAMDEMNDTELQLELFDMLDTDSDGRVQLQDIVAWVSVSEELLNTITPKELEEAAGGGTSVDRTQFGHFLVALVNKAGGSFKDWAELLVLDHRVSPTRAESVEPLAHNLAASLSPEGSKGVAVKEAVTEDEEEVPDSALNTAAKDGRMRDLFALFDMDLDGRVGFKDVAVGLHKIAPHVPIEKTSEAALQVLLSYDKDHDRTLDYSEFVHFICAFLHAGGLTFSQVAGGLVYAAARPDPSDEEQARIDALAGVPAEDFDTFADWRAHKIFDLLDRDHDGRISFKELVLGLHRFEPTTPLQRTAEEAAALLEEAHLGGGDEEAGSLQGGLDRAQFVQLLDKFVQASGASFDQLADYLVALSARPTVTEEGAGQEDGATLPSWWFQKFLWEGAGKAAGSDPVDDDA